MYDITLGDPLRAASAFHGRRFLTSGAMIRTVLADWSARRPHGGGIGTADFGVTKVTNHLDSRRHGFMLAITVVSVARESMYVCMAERMLYNDAEAERGAWSDFAVTTLRKRGHRATTSCGHSRRG